MMKKSIAITWKGGRPEGAIETANCRLVKAAIGKGKGRVKANRFEFSSPGGGRLEARFEAASLGPGPNAALVTVRAKANPFTFFLRDVNSQSPIFIPAYGVAVLPAEDTRSYEEVERDVRNKGLITSLERMEREPEETFENAAANTRNLVCPTWLGISRDVRIFEIGFEYEGQWDDYVTPRFHNTPVTVPELEGQPVRYNFMVGRGVGCTRRITRRLEDGWMPMLHATVEDGEVHFDCTAFVSLEYRALTQKNLRGTHFLVADSLGFGFRQTAEQERERKRLAPSEMNRDEETVLYFRAVATNTARTPKYAWFRSAVAATGGSWTAPAKSQDGRFESGRVYAVSKVNGRPMPQEEMAVLVAPGGTCSFEFRIPHSPITASRAARLLRQDFDKRREECRAFWQAKFAEGASIAVPEKRIEEMVRASLCHIDLVTFGREPRGTVGPSVGRYCPIGLESSQIIQSMDSLGRHGLARRALTYFLDKQHEDGFMQNYESVMVETGPALWTIGEHYRYTKDDGWARKVAPKLVKSCDYLIAWSRRNRRAELKGRGYGLLDGRIADPNDPYRTFMLNGYAYLGMSRVAEMLLKINPRESARIRREAETLRRLVRRAFFEGVARSPVVPLSDGTWCPTAPPWAEGTGPACLYVEKINAYTHATFVARDSIIGPMFLVAQEVLDPGEPAGDWLLAYYAEYFCDRNAAYSQPYLSVHPKLHLVRGEAKAFLAAYYNTVSALADRETYTFWEHFFQASVHKTHEEAEFLMQTRWMLWMEEGQTLKLFPGIPRAWMADGKVIDLKRAATYFGPVSARVESKLAKGIIDATVEFHSEHRPKAVEIRLPHPEGQRAAGVSGGRYDGERETVVIEPPRKRVKVTAEY